MKAQNLTVCVPYKGCNKNCEYCVSRMTGYMHPRPELFKRNLAKVKQVARAAQVSSVLLTGKGEPTQNWEMLEHLVNIFSDWPVELQTNGLDLAWMVSEGAYGEQIGKIDALHKLGLDVVALSFDRLEQFGEMSDLFKVLLQLGFVRRVTLNITNKIPRHKRDPKKLFQKIMSLARKANVQQLSFRQVTVPNGVEITKRNKLAWAAKQWIEKNVDYDHYYDLVGAAKDAAIRQAHRIRELPYGAEVWDIDGVAVTWFDYCVQDEHRAHDVRSLIYQEDGHLYTAWNSPASILF